MDKVVHNKVVQEKVLREQIKSEKRLLDSLFPSTPAPNSLWQKAQKVSVQNSNNKSFSRDEFCRLLSLAVVATTEQPETDVCAVKQKKTFGIVEFCCDADSEIGKQCDRLNIPVLRITKDDPCQEPATIHKCLDFLATYDRVHIHG